MSKEGWEGRWKVQYCSTCAQHALCLCCAVAAAGLAECCLGSLGGQDACASAGEVVL